MANFRLTRRQYLKLGVTAGIGVGLVGPALVFSPPAAVAQATGFRLPFEAEPGPATWYLRQWYGNTRWAYRQRRALYSQGQGFHFGVDFWAPCGTPVVAIGDGTVAAVDGPYGAAPHNLVIRHSNGWASLYGHLLTRSPMRVGQSVRQGQVVAETGAPSGSDCNTHPHLHLEIRDSSLSRATNPVNLIQADWYNLTLGVDSEGLQFQLDLNQPDRWQTITDQPDVRFGAALYNDYGRTAP
ncbi:MAG: M23 family metallopeptidase [Chloroflexi bacterium]|nr:M23 family metallopeptidase [Chloroflexota bacterium]